MIWSIKVIDLFVARYVYYDPGVEHFFKQATQDVSDVGGSLNKHSQLFVTLLDLFFIFCNRTFQIINFLDPRDYRMEKSFEHVDNTLLVTYNFT